LFLSFLFYWRHLEVYWIVPIVHSNFQWNNCSHFSLHMIGLINVLTTMWCLLKRLTIVKIHHFIKIQVIIIFPFYSKMENFSWQPRPIVILYLVTLVPLRSLPKYFCCVFLLSTSSPHESHPFEFIISSQKSSKIWKIQISKQVKGHNYNCKFTPSHARDIIIYIACKVFT